MKRVAWFTAIILATITLALLLWEFRAAMMLFAWALALAAAVRPLIDWFVAHRLPHGLAVLIAYGGCVSAISVLVPILSGPLFADLQQLTMDLTKGYDNIKTGWPHGNQFQQLIAQQLPAANELYQAVTGEQGSTLLRAVLGATLSSFDLIGQVIISLVLSIYWSTDQERFKRLWLSLLPFGRRARAREIWQNIEHGLGAYLRSELLQSVLAVILLGVGYQALGLKYPVVLGVAGAVSWLIPWVGVLLGLIPPLLVGLSVSPGLGLAAAGLTIGVFAFLEFVVEPRLFNRRRFSSLLVVIVVLILADEYGLLGVLLAPPLAAVIQIFAGQFIQSTPATTLTTPLARPITVLHGRLVAVQAILHEQVEPPPPEIINLADRLAQLIDRASEEEQLFDERVSFPASDPPGWISQSVGGVGNQS